MPINNRQTAYTLLELLIALAIFSIIAIICVTGLHTAIQSYQHTREDLVQLQALQKTQALFYQDISQMLDYPSQPIKMKSSLQQTELQFIRGGYPTAGQSHLRQVTYIFTQHTLYRKVDGILEKRNPKPRIILSQINNFRLRFLDRQNHFSLRLPSGAHLPKAVEITLTLDKGDITWLFIVPGMDLKYAAT